MLTKPPPHISMGEWSEYFEDFPEEDPANQHNGVYDPEGAKRARSEAKVRDKVIEDSKALQEKLDAIAAKARENARRRVNG